jgi:hypothetical protein
MPGADVCLPASPPPRSPYRYGHIGSVTLSPEGEPEVEKWYTMGRAAWELA